MPGFPTCFPQTTVAEKTSAAEKDGRSGPSRSGSRDTDRRRRDGAGTLVRPQRSQNVQQHSRLTSMQSGIRHRSTGSPDTRPLRTRGIRPRPCIRSTDTRTWPYSVQSMVPISAPPSSRDSPAAAVGARLNAVSYGRTMRPCSRRYTLSPPWSMGLTAAHPTGPNALTPSGASVSAGTAHDSCQRQVAHTNARSVPVLARCEGQVGRPHTEHTPSSPLWAIIWQ